MIALISFAVLAFFAFRLSDIWVDLFGDSPQRTGGRPAANAAPDPQSLFAQRSPGSRGAGATASAKQLKQLKQIKPTRRQQSLAQLLPHGTVIERPLPALGDWNRPEMPLGPAYSPQQLIFPAAFVPTPHLEGLGDVPPLAVPPTPPGIGSPPGAPIYYPPVIVPQSPLPPTPVIPELSTWAMMIAGFGLMGAILRAGRRPTAPAEEA